MTSKDYKMIADAIREQKKISRNHGHSSDAAFRYLAIRLGIAFGEQNAKFNPDKFIEACSEPRYIP